MPHCYRTQVIITPDKAQVGLPRDFDPAGLAAINAAGWENPGDLMAAYRTILDEGRANLNTRVTATLVRVTVNPAFSNDAQHDFLVPLCPGCNRLVTLVESLEATYTCAPPAAASQPQRRSGEGPGLPVVLCCILPPVPHSTGGWSGEGPGLSVVLCCFCCLHLACGSSGGQPAQHPLQLSSIALAGRTPV
jgi:hypothetical protein